jgi:cell filamentation protein
LKQAKRYDTSGLTEAQFEPGSRSLALKNLMGIKSKREMDRIKAVALKQAEESFFRNYDANHRFTAKDVCDMHKVWLGKIYSWAGKYRQVNRTRENFRFATVGFIPQLMKGFEEGPLKQHTPCNFKDRERVIKTLAEVHTEFILIHPFREGNGRIGRVLSTLMALQSGFPPLDFSPIQGKKRQDYFKTVRAGLDRKYEPMENVFSCVLERTLKSREE